MLKVSVITLSYNKKDYVLDAIESVLNQSFSHFEYIIIENSTDTETRRLVRERIQDNPQVIYIPENPTQEERDQYYQPAVFLNKYLGTLTGEYILYLSDDDILDTDCLKKTIAYLDSHPDQAVCWFGMKSVKGSKAAWDWADNGQIPADRIITKDQGADCVLDGGAVLIRKTALEQLEEPYFDTSWENAKHCDGIFLNKLNRLFDFYPLNEFLLTHRVTEVSTHFNR